MNKIKVLLVTLSIFLYAGCESIEHIREYRSLTNQFNETVREHNLQIGTSSVNEPLDPQKSLELHEKYKTLAELFGALNNNSSSKSALEKDKLYSRSKVLELICKWYAAFHEAKFRLVSDQELTDDNTPIGKIQAEVTALGNSFIQSSVEKIFLLGFKGRASYDINILQAYQLLNSPRDKVTKKQWLAVVKKLLEAEKQFADSLAAVDNKKLIVQIRKNMFWGIHNVLNKSDAYKDKNNKRWTKEQLKTKLPLLMTRYKALIKDLDDLKILYAENLHLKTFYEVPREQ